MKLLLIDSRLNDINTIINSLQNTTKHIIVDYYNDTFSEIKNKINTLGESQYTSIAYMAHGEYQQYYKMLNSQETEAILISINELDTNIDSWNEISTFWTDLVTQYNVQYIDYLGCCLIDMPEWLYIFNKLNEKTNATFRGSSNETGNMNGADWILETDGTNVIDLYFTENILNYPYNLFPLIADAYSKRVLLQTIPGSVVTWGNLIPGGNSLSVAANLTSNVVIIYNTSAAFAALKVDGSVVTWSGTINEVGGNSSRVASNLTSNVSSIYSTNIAFAALKVDGSVVTWGNDTQGGNSSLVAANLISNVVSISETWFAFAALKNNGSVITWGLSSDGGDSSLVAANLTSNVVSINSTTRAFAALKVDGSVVTWGSATLGGNSSLVAANLTSNVVSINKNLYAFVALKNDGSVVTWGSDTQGGNTSSPINAAADLTSNVVSIYSTQQAFAALKNNGSVVTWGSIGSGGNSAIYSGTTFVSSVADRLTSNVVSIYSTTSAFAALKNDGSVVTWGSDTNGSNSSSVAANLTSNVVSIYSTLSAFAALKNDGSVVTWGSETNGGNSSSVAANLTSNVVSIYSTAGAFAALKIDGSVVAWGNSTRGGNTSSPINVAADLTSNVSSIYSTTGAASNVGSAFAAIKSNPTSISSFSDKHKVDILKNKVNRSKVTDNSLTIIGNTNINKNLISGKTYNLIKNIDTSLTYSDLGSNFYIPSIEGETVTIDNRTFRQYDDSIYELVNGYLQKITNPINILGKQYYLYPGSIIGKLYLTISEVSKTSTSITISLSGSDVDGNLNGNLYIIAGQGQSSSAIKLGTQQTATSTESGIVNYTLSNLTSSTYYNIIFVSSNNDESNILEIQTSVSGGGGGDPHIETIKGIKYNLPNDENCYLLFDNNNLNDRVRITTKSWFLPNNRMYNFWNNYMEDTSFFRYVNVQHNNDNLTIDLENLNIVEYNERNINNHTLKQTTNKTTIRISDKYEDKNILSRHYGDYKRNLYKIKFNGVSRKININTNNTNYEIRVSCDLNCADERNEIYITGTNFNNCTGALICKEQGISIPSLI